MTHQEHTQSGCIGLIGVGLLGSAMAERLLTAGLSIRGFDIDRTRCALLAKLGGEACRNPAEVFQDCSTLILSLPSSDIVERLVSQHADSMRSGQTVIDTTTGDPQQMMAIGEFLKAKGVHYGECTIAGSSAQVREGQAVLLLGGEVQVLAQAESVLASLSSNRFHLGPIGSASRFKLVHNLLLGLHRAVLAEGLSFAEKLGFEPTQTLEILKQTPAASSVMGTKGPRMVGRDFVPQARLSQHLKDVRLILAEAHRAGAAVPLSEVHGQLLQQAEELGLGELDNSAVIEVYRQAADAAKANHADDQS